MPSKNRNKKRRLISSADVRHEVVASKSLQHSPQMYNSHESTVAPSKFVANWMAIASSCISSPTLTPQTLSSGMFHHSEISCSDVGKNKRNSPMTDIIQGKTSDEILKCSTIADGHLLGTINSESPHEAMTLLYTRVDSLTLEGLNQALISACRRGHKLLVQTLIRVGADIEHQDDNGNTPLLISADHGFTDIVQFLVSRGANVNARNSTGSTALILSVHPAGSTYLTRFLLEQQDVDIHHENQDGDSALNRATRFMDVDTMRLLLEKSFAEKGCRDAHLVKCEAYSYFFNSEAQSVKQETISAKAGLENVYTVLKEHLITGKSPLELALKAGDTKSFDIFLHCQFSCSSDKKRYVDNALKHMFSNSQCSNERMFSSVEITIIQKLLQHGADVNQGSSPSPFSCAVAAGDFQLVELMFTHGATLQRDYHFKDDPLCIAAKNGHRDLIELLLQNGAVMNAQVYCQSALDYALRRDHTECAKLLIHRGAKMKVAFALKSAVKHHRPLYMRFLFENYKRKIMDYFSKTILNARELLILAIKKGDCEIIGHILDAGTDVNGAYPDGQLPLVLSDNRAVVKFLIQRGADVNHVIEDRNGSWTPLSYWINRMYCSLYTFEVCKVLIENGASVNCRGGDGKTPLMMVASYDSCVNMLQMLLDNGADVNDKDNKGNTTLLHAITNRCFKIASCLIDSTADKKNVINIQNNEGFTPLIVSMKEGNVAIITKLIEEGADVNIKDNKENTALHHLLTVCPRDSEDILASLLKAGSLVNCQNKEGLSPLMLAAKKSKASLMSKLLDAGADVNAVSKNNNSQTAMSFLPGIPYFEIETILCIETLLHRDAISFYLSHQCFSTLIFQNRINLIHKLIQHGVGPADSKANKTPWEVTHCGILRSPIVLSPLCVALLRGNISLAQYFVDILFLTSSDLSMFANNNTMERLLKEERQQKSWNFLQELSSQPMTLDNLCLVTVSAAVGSSPGREARVDSLPLPQMMKDRLRFKSMNGEGLALSELHS